MQTKNIYSKLNDEIKNNIILIAGPCVVENETMPFEIAEELKRVSDKLNFFLIFKASYRKANRSSLNSFTGIGDQKALQIIHQVGKQFNIPTITDIHSEDEAKMAADFVDMLQIPAFLCRQTDLLIAAAKTGKIINIKKGQFLSPEAMKFAVDKVRSAGNPNVMITERGTMFGYQDLIVDYRGINALKENNCPVILDATHSLQVPNQPAGVTGGKPELIDNVASAGVAVGFDGIFIETHPEPSKALSDGANMLQLSKLENLLTKLIRIKKSIL